MAKETVAEIVKFSPIIKSKPVIPTANTSHTRNSRARAVLSRYVAPAIEALDRAVPNLDTNLITVGGAVVYSCGSDYARNHIRENKNLFWPGVKLFSGISTDFIDGFHIRTKARRLNTTPEKLNKHGQLIDAVFDRINTLKMRLTHMREAHDIHDSLGKKLALAAAVTDPLTSITRSLTEWKKGEAVAEIGNNILSIGGNHPIRFIGGTIASLSPNKSIRRGSDAYFIGSNLYSAGLRLLPFLDKNPSPKLSQIDRDKARTRAFTLITTGALVAGYAIHEYNNLNPENRTLDISGLKKWSKRNKENLKYFKVNTLSSEINSRTVYIAPKERWKRHLYSA